VICKKSNKHGYFPAETDNSECTGCAACALMCPDAVIEVYRDDNTREKPRNKRKAPLVEEKV
jgi:2-oxoglutarate ferredoxin oxidoreductase subunit delta